MCEIWFVHARTFVPDARSDRSRVLPAGTSMLFSTMVEHDLGLELAQAAELNVQELEARLTKKDCAQSHHGPHRRTRCEEEV